MNFPMAGLAVLDLGGDRTAMLGRMLADLGASVTVPDIMMRPQESPEDEMDVRMYRAVFGIGKSSANGDADDAGSFDVVLCGDLSDLPEPAHASSWLEEHPQTIVVSVTAYGSGGPFEGRPSSDLVNIAMSGYLHMTGNADRPPLKTSAPFLSWRHASNHALIGLLLALRHRRLTGEGSHVDVAARETGLWMLTHTYQYWDMQRINLSRKGASRDVGRAGVSVPSVYGCKDGTVIWVVLSGRLGQGSIDKLVAWIDSEGMAPSWLLAVDWATLDLASLESIDDFVQPFAAFFRTKTSNELLERAIRDGFMLAPAYPMERLLEDPQLESRSSWTSITMNEQRVRIPTSPARFDGFSWRPSTPVHSDGDISRMPELP